ncbi:MAG: hypothetical protein KIT27_08310 [Legionellales bacterium]|nr:hypothetical protein [Legionellales bacterium]
MAKSSAQKSFQNLMLAETFFMIGYIVIKIGLPLILKNKGFDLISTYSMSTTTAAIFSLANLLLGTFLQDIGNNKLFMIAGLAMSAFGFTTLNFCNNNFIILSLTFFVIGSALYCINLNLFVNNHFQDKDLRHQANNIYQIILNFGALIGLFILILGLHFNKKIFVAGTLAIFSSMIILLSRKIIAIDIKVATLKKISLRIIALLFIAIFCYLALSLRSYSRIIILMVFVGSIVMIARDYFQTLHTGYLKFLTLLLLCVFTYWLAIAVYYNQLSVFLSEHVNTVILGILVSPLLALSVDPIVNIIFGSGIVKLQSIKSLNANNMMYLGLVSFCFAFFLLANVHWLYPLGTKIPLYWILISIAFIAVGEFLIFPTMQSQISELITNKSKQGFYMGMIQFTSASASVCAYYLIKISHRTLALGKAISIPMDSYRLYQYICLIFLSCIIIYFIINKSGCLEKC